MTEKLIYVVHVAKCKIETMPWETGKLGFISKQPNVTELFDGIICNDDYLIIATCSTVDMAVKYRDAFISHYRLHKVNEVKDPEFDLYYKHCYQDIFGNTVSIKITSKYLDSDRIVYSSYNEELK